MARKNGKKDWNVLSSVPQETRRAIVVVLLVVAGLFLTLASFDAAGIAGSDAYRLFAKLLGIGYFLLPVLCFVLAGNALREERGGITTFKLIASALFFVAGLGFIQVVSQNGGLLGGAIADPAVKYLDTYASLIMLGGLTLISLLLLLEGNITLEPLSALWRALRALYRKLTGGRAEGEPKLGGFALDADAEDEEANEEEDEGELLEQASMPERAPARAQVPVSNLKSLLSPYTPPPLSFL